MWELKKDKKGKFYFKNGKIKSEEFEYAEKYNDGFAVVQKEKNGPYYYRDEFGNLVQKSYMLKSYKNGFGQVKATESSDWQFRDVKGLLSEPFAYIDDYYQGYAIVKKSYTDKYRFRDTSGKLSDDSYDRASYYRNGYSVVENSRTNLFRFRDLNGNLSEEFAFASAYFDGLALVKVVGEDNYRFRDVEGKISEDSYAEASSYGYGEPENYEGFAVVKEHLAALSQYRDLLGNVTDDISSIGKEFLDYYRNNKTVFELSLECFLDEKFLKEIMNREQNLLMQASEHCQTEEDFKELSELADYTAEYIKDMTYEAYKKQEEGNDELKRQRELKDKINYLKSKIKQMF